ncbi:MAG TPA: alpha/beta fold hydrolase [Roseiflexaceae bacterium]|nr:alpha/beta fold hydrolase [Roseiflexaceae bacterium]
MSEAEQLISTWTEVGGLRMHARVASATAPGLPIVLVHGLVVSSRYMIPLAQLLARQAPVYAPDLPGFGKSDHPTRPLDIAGLAGGLAGWMRASGIARAVLVGNSMGCQVIADLARREPALVDRAVLIGPTIDRRGRNVLEQVRRLVAVAPYENPSLAGVQVRDIWSAGLRETLATTRYAIADRIETKLPGLPMPVLVVSGSRDRIAPPRWAAQLASLLPRGQLHILAGGGHALNYSAPKQLLSIVAPFLCQQLETWVEDGYTELCTSGAAAG